ncbi:Ribosomal RNA large subunit methyltransferase E, partial [Frankliniella fusca]
SSGQHSAEEVVRCIKEWDCAEDVVPQCSDTSTGNTGYNIGAGVCIEAGLGKSLPFFACRHYILELIPKGLFDKMVERSTSPDIGALCKDLQEKWANMDQSSCKPATQDPACLEFLRVHGECILSFALQTLEVNLIVLIVLLVGSNIFVIFFLKFSFRNHTRADYRQLAELIIIFMGENPYKPKEIRFSPPEAVSSARFMARIIYCLLIHMFSLTGAYCNFWEFQIDEKQLANIRHFNLFFVSTYMKPW